MEIDRIVKYVIVHETCAKRPISNLRLQKLLYFIQVYFIIKIKECCYDEIIEAWDFGPVIPTIFNTYKQYLISDIKVEDKCIWVEMEKRLIINQILNMCSEYSTSQLVEISKKQNPWLEAYYNTKDKIITTEMIKEYFGDN